MKVFFGLGFTVKLAFFCLLTGIGVGLYLGEFAGDHGAPATAVPTSVSHQREPCNGEEVVITWSRTSTSSSCSGS